VRDPEIVSSTNPALSQSVIDTIVQWRYKPAKHDGMPISVHLTTPFSFRLAGDAP
jgi:TonB family protein